MSCSLTMRGVSSSSRSKSGKPRLVTRAGSCSIRSLPSIGTEGADFLEEDALNRVEELVGIDEAAELDAGNRFDENGAEKAEKVAFRGDVFAGVGDSVGHF